MYPKVQLLYFAVLVVLLSPAAAGAAPPADSIDPAGVERLLDDSGGTATIRHHRLTGAVRFARFEPGSLTLSAPLGATVGEKARAFFDDYGSTFGISDFELELVPVGRRTDHHGFTHLAYRQVYRGVPVFAGVLLVHFDPADRLTAVNGTFLPRLALDNRPAWSRGQAAEVAVGTVESQLRQENGETTSKAESLAAAGSTLYVFRAGLAKGVPGPVHLVWEIEVVSAEPGVRELVYVDAHNGKVVDQITGIHDALDREVHQTSLGNLVWEEGDSDPIPNPWAGENDPVVLEDWQDEIDGAKETYNLFRHLTNGDYVSYDGADATMKSVDLECSGNAWWDSTAANFCNGFTTDDIVTHEWGHGYTEWTHGLIYQWQPGALNEAYSDMWGETVDLLNGRGTDLPDGHRTDGSCSVYGGGPSQDNTYRWLMGEDREPGGALRDMWRPRCHNDPGKVSDSQYWCLGGDSGGVHHNSGVPNHAFALLTDGGTYNGQTIAAIGLTKTTNLFWRAGSVYQVPTTDFVDHADALEASCTDLIGVTPLYEPKTDDTTPSDSGEIFDATDCAQVTKAIAAVELRTEPAQCGFTPLLDPDEPALCGGGTVVTISLADWESGLGSWTADTRDVANPATFDTPDWAVVGSLPDDRPGQAAFVIDDPALGDCITDDESGVLYLESPAIAIPGGSSNPWIALDHWVATEAAWDGGNLKISVNGGGWTLVPSGAFTFNPYNTNLATVGQGNTNPMAGESAFTGSDGGKVTGTWGQSQLSLAGIAAAGDSIKLRLDMGLDGCNGLVGWYVDDVRVYDCPPADLGLGKLDSPDPVVAGEQLTYTLQVDNNGPSAAVNVVVSDTLPPGVSLVSTSGCGEDPNGAPICSLGDLANGQSASYTLTVLVGSDVPAATILTNTATVSSDILDDNAANDLASTQTTVVVNADLAIVKTDLADPSPAGEPLSYSIQVSNNGPSNAAGVVVTDTLPAGVTLVSTAGCAEDPVGVSTCSLGGIGASQSTSFALTVLIDPIIPPDSIIVNSATVASSTPDSTAANNATAEQTTVSCPDDLALSGMSLSGTLTYKAQDTITAGPNLVIDGESVELVAGNSIIFKSGVEIGGSFSARVTPDPCP